VRLTAKIVRNLAVAQFKLLDYEAALASFERIMASEPNARDGFSVILCRCRLAHEPQRLKDAFADLVHVELEVIANSQRPTRRNTGCVTSASSGVIFSNVFRLPQTVDDSVDTARHDSTGPSSFVAPGGVNWLLDRLIEFKRFYVALHAKRGIARRSNTVSADLDAGIAHRAALCQMRLKRRRAHTAV